MYVHTYVHIYVCMYICIYVLCMYVYVSMYACRYIHMGVLDIEQIPPNVSLHKILFCLMKNAAGTT
jgi:hypothetical protein